MTEILYRGDEGMPPDLREKIEEAVSQVLIEEGLEEKYEISISFVSKEEIQELNRDYRGIDRATDVLSFPFDMGDINIDADIPLGDVVICLDIAEDQARSLGHSEEREIIYLLVHSLFHLLGYDHIEEEDKRIMRAKEKAVMKSLGVFKYVE